MEAVAAQMARPLRPLFLGPNLAQRPSIESNVLATQCMQEWTGFGQLVLSMIGSLDLTASISISDGPTTETDPYGVGDEMGINARFTAQVAVPLSKAFRALDLPMLFGDPRIDTNNEPGTVDDQAILHVLDTAAWNTMIVGKIETPWTLNLIRASIGTSVGKAGLRRVMGQTVSYMRHHGLKYAFVSTFSATIFIRRTNNLRFEILLPISYDATGPSMRECFLVLAMMAHTDGFHFEEEEDFNRSLVGHDTGQLPPMLQRFQVHDLHVNRSIITRKSVFFGEESSVVHVRCGRRLSGEGEPGARAVFEDMVEEQRDCVFKIFSERDHPLYERELETYLKVEGARSSEGPGGLFSEVLAYVPIICSSLKASGYVLVLEKVPGVKLSTIWGTVSHEDVGNKLVRAVEVLRKVGCVHGDPNRDNILYDEHSSRLVLLDLESTYANDEGFDVEDGPELYYIMGQ